MPRRLAIALLVLALPLAFAQDNSASLTGKVQYTFGQGIDNATAGLDSESGVVHQEAQTNAEGVFRFSGLPAGTYFLKWPSFNAPRSKLTLSPGEERSLPPVSLTIGIAGDCSGEAMDPERTEFLPDPAKGVIAGHVEKGSAPVVGVWATVQRMFGPDPNPVLGVKTSSQGDFSLADLAPGRYVLGIGEIRKGMWLSVAGGIESWYSIKLDPLPPDPNPPKLMVCE